MVPSYLNILSALKLYSILPSNFEGLNSIYTKIDALFVLSSVSTASVPALPAPEKDCSDASWGS